MYFSKNAIEPKGKLQLRLRAYAGRHIIANSMFKKYGCYTCSTFDECYKMLAADFDIADRILLTDEEKSFEVDVTELFDLFNWREKRELDF